MPELPELETIKNQLQPTLPLKVDKVEFSPVSSSIVKDQDCELIGKTITSIERYGKVLRFYIDSDFRIISGLGMSGSWRLSKTKIQEKHTHIQISGLKGKTRWYLGYVDPRRFGTFHIFNLENEKEWLTRLGPDVSSPDFNFDYLWELRKSKPTKVLKPFLLEQKFFAGVGNYMASEICARAYVRPTRKMATLTKRECQALIDSTKSVLEDSIKNNGTTFSGGYSDANGDKGMGVQNLVVFYQKICGLCKETEVKKITLAQRGTYFCPKCQK